VEVYFKLQELEEDIHVFLDHKAASNYVDVLRTMSKLQGVFGRPRISHLLRLEGVIKTEKRVDIDSLKKNVEILLAESIADFDQSRIREGGKTQQDILHNLQIMEQSLGIVREKASELEDYIKNNLKERFHQLLGEGADETRIYSEIAIQLVKYSISEELQRMEAHSEQFRSIVKMEGAVGKKLDFLCQELNREVNTIGSKSFIIEINQAVIEIKDAIEKIREQVRNVE
jgi:uncharacterized protein (TIGR00255 family)